MTEYEEWELARKGKLAETIDAQETARLVISEAMKAEGLRDEINRLHERIEQALAIAREDGTTDGDHHKMWVIDQMVRALTGEAYNRPFQ